MELIFDSHAHYDGPAFDSDREELLQLMPQKNVSGIINCGADLKSSYKSIALTEKYPFIWAAVGVHPHEAEAVPKHYLEELNRLASSNKVVAIGEIGLDYHYDFAAREVQREVFTNQILLAKELDLPVIIHDREAHADTLSILQTQKPKGVIHCFSGSTQVADELIRLGFFLGFGGAVTFKNAKKPAEIAAQIPLNRLLLETDAPYMTPVPYRGNRCDSSMIAFTAQKIAELRGISEEEVLLHARKNAEFLFGINDRSEK